MSEFDLRGQFDCASLVARLALPECPIARLEALIIVLDLSAQKQTCYDFVFCGRLFRVGSDGELSTLSFKNGLVSDDALWEIHNTNGEPATIESLLRTYLVLRGDLIYGEESVRFAEREDGTVVATHEIPSLGIKDVCDGADQIRNRYFDKNSVLALSFTQGGTRALNELSAIMRLR